MATQKQVRAAKRNVKKALSAMWQIVNDLDLKYEQLYDVGV